MLNKNSKKYHSISPNKKNRIINASPSHLVRKYGHHKVELLEQYLNDALQESIKV